MSQPDLHEGQLEIFDSSKPICFPLLDFSISRAKDEGALIEEITCVAFLALEIPTYKTRRSDAFGKLKS
jgi:hypothetical protein